MNSLSFSHSLFPFLLQSRAALRLAAALVCIMGFTQADASAAPTIHVTTPSQTVSSTYVQVTGTVSGAAKPMWYEIHRGTVSGPMTDYGAFPQNASWFFIARHLGSGNNAVTVFAADSNNNITQATINLAIDTSGTPAIRPRPFPAEVWWGGLGSNDQLQSNPTQWMTVKKYADAYFFHTAYWDSSKNGLMQSLVQQEAPYGTKFIAELGGTTGTDSGWPQWQFHAWGAGGGWLSDRYNNTGLILTEATHDFEIINAWPSFAAAYPTWSETQINDTISSEWQTYYQLNSTVFPHLKEGVTTSPVWWGWNSFPALLPRTENDQFTANGRAYSFSIAQLMQDFVTKTSAAHMPWSFYSDFPWYTMVWDQGSQEGAACRQKVLAYETWLHQNNSRHTAVCNDDTSSEAATNLPAANQDFYDRSLKSLYLTQSEGHRPNQILFESWLSYSGGPLPTIVTPEDATNSYTGIAKAAIDFIKGIRDSNGGLETLQLTQSTRGNTTTFVLTNTGSGPCIPALAAIETGDPSITTQWFDPSHNNITSQVDSAEGWTYCPAQDTTGSGAAAMSGLKPGATVTITCQAAVPAGSSSKQVQLEAFWNPQDPTGIVRGRQIVNFTPGGFAHKLIPGSLVSLQSLANGKYVNADNNGSSPLIANAATVGTSETFTVVDAGNGNIGLKSQINGMYVCADNAGANPLIANRTAIGSWETFTEVDAGSGNTGLQSLVNGKYVNADNGGGSPLIANGASVGAGETFTVHPAQTSVLTFANGSFEAPSVGSASYQYNPTGGSWTFTGYSGVQSNGSLWYAPAAPDGTQTAFLQGYPGPAGAGSLSQSVTFPTTGTYVLTFQAARRQGQVQPLKLSVDGVQVGGLLTAAGNSFAPLTSATFTISTAGAHTITLSATNNSADLSVFVDQVSVAVSTLPILANGSFEAPSVGSASYQYNPTGGSWTFSGYSGVQSNGSLWYAPAAPDGTQTAFLQGYPGPAGAGSLSQSVTFPTTGSYVLTFQAARRQGQVQPLKLTVDGVQVGGLLTAAGNSFAPLTSATFPITTAGTHTITLSATNNSADLSAFVDQVTLSPM